MKNPRTFTSRLGLRFGLLFDSFRRQIFLGRLIPPSECDDSSCTGAALCCCNRSDLSIPSPSLFTPCVELNSLLRVCDKLAEVDATNSLRLFAYTEKQTNRHKTHSNSILRLDRGLFVVHCKVHLTVCLHSSLIVLVCVYEQHHKSVLRA